MPSTAKLPTQLSAAGPESEPSRGLLLAAGAALMVATFAAFGPLMNAGFLWDDDLNLTENPAVSSPAGLRAIWFEPNATPQYYPLTFTTLWLEHRMWGAQPRGYHAVNILLHSANAVLLWLLLRRLRVRYAWLIAAAFALHPLQVEAVGWISQRKTVLSAALCLLSLLAYSEFRPLAVTRKTRLARAALYAASLAAYAAAMLSKTAVCGLPGVLLVMTWWKRRRVDRGDFALLAPFLAVGIALSLITIRVENRFGMEGPEWAYSFVERILIAGRALWFYVQKLVWPTQLAFVYPRWTIDAGDWRQHALAVAALVALAALWLARDRIGRGPTAGALVFGGMLFPVLSFANLYYMRYSLVADHFQYLACIGVIGVVLSGVGFTLRSFGRAGVRFSRLAATAALCALAVLAWRQSRIYADPETLWRDTILKNPASALAHYNLAYHLSVSDRRTEAIPHYQSAIAIDPRHRHARHNLAIVYAEAGELDAALSLYAGLVQDYPEDAHVRFNHGLTLAQAGRAREAIAAFREAVRIDPGFAEAHFRLAAGLLGAGLQDQAADHFQRTLELRPSDDVPRLFLAQIHANRGRSAQAVRQYRAFLRSHPNHRDALLGLAWILATDDDAANRNGPQAFDLADRAVQAANYRDPHALDVLAAAFAENGQFGPAVAAARDARRLAIKNGFNELARQVEQRLELYRAEKPYHEAPQQPTTTSAPHRP